MVEQHTAAEIEKKVLAYIYRKTEAGYTFDFNPLNVSKEGIADGLNLDIEEVEEAIERLTGKFSDSSSKSLERIESIKPKFEIWLPHTEKGKEIKDELCQSGLAVKGNSNVLYSALITALGYILTIPYPYVGKYVTLDTPATYFLWAAFVTAISIPLGNYFAQKWYKIDLELQKVKGSKYYIYAMVITIVFALFSYYQEWDVAVILTAIAAVANIISVIFQIATANSNRRK